MLAAHVEENRMKEKIPEDKKRREEKRKNRIKEMGSYNNYCVKTRGIYIPFG